MFEDSMTPSELYESHLKRCHLRVLKQSQLPISKPKTLLGEAGFVAQGVHVHSSQAFRISLVSYDPKPNDQILDT